MASPCVLLISPGILKWTDVDFGLPHLVALGGYLRQTTGVRVEILDVQYENTDHAGLSKTIAALGPHLLIGLSCYSSFDTMRVMTLARYLKAQYPEVPLISGGYHASALPGDLVFEDSPFDAVVQGEGEVPTRRIVEELLGGQRISKPIWPHEQVDDPDTLPPYAWDLLQRYWPRAHQIGRKFQIYLSRGCPYRCVFCMERAKTDYSWRAFSPARALDELRRLASVTDLSRWVVNIGDPLFGFHRAWRREVLEGIAQEGLFPRQYWTLTRSDDLDEEDVALFARARFSIGIGLESGSPEMLRVMRKGNTAERYLGAIERLAALSRVHGLNWAANIIVGHPGETRQTLEETHRFLTRLYTSAAETCGWVSIDPFRLYPGSWIHQEMPRVEQQYGTRFHHKRWWTSWYDGPFRAEHVDPSASLSFEERVEFMYTAYPPLIAEVQRRFRGQGTSVDRVFRASLDEQIEQLGPERKDALLKHARVAREPVSSELSFPIGLRVADPRVRRREAAVRRLLDEGLLRGERLVEALLQVAPEDHMPVEVAERMLLEQVALPEIEGEAPYTLPFRFIARGLEALEPAPGDRAADLCARSGYVGALLRQLVGAGEVRLYPPPAGRLHAEGGFDVLWIGAAMPRFPRHLLPRLNPGGRALAVLGPRFRAQDLCLVDAQGERVLGKVRVGVLGGPDGWVPLPQSASPAELSFGWREAPALAYRVLAQLDLGADAASIHDPSLPERAWATPLSEAYAAAPGRLTLHALPLACAGAEGLLARLRVDPPLALRDAAGARLCERFAEAIEAEIEDFRAQRQADLPRAEARSAELVAAVAEPLMALRRRLYEPSGRPPPPLLVLDCPALGRHGRASTTAGQRVVAVSLDQPIPHVLCQILHEEMHPITDPLVSAEAERDTRVGSPGFAVHQALEEVAVAATEAVLEQDAPQHLPAFYQWRARVYAS